ncbi:unnamed protein product [Rotaria sp. Silwood2]|nr:unnamed protein product [Rotaria sp. Silwood2]
MGATKTEHFTNNQNDIAAIAKALGHPARIAIMEYLIKVDTCICGDIVNELPLSQPTISQHLKELKNAGLIKGNIEGNAICYCVLILCTGNSCRSQMAQGYIQYFAGNEVQVYSAGIETHGVNPKAIEIMKEDGIDISTHTSDNVTEYKDIEFDFVITVCDNAKENCPYFPAKTKNIHQNFPDPAKAIGTESEIVEQFRKAREMIKSFSEKFVSEDLGKYAVQHGDETTLIPMKDALHDRGISAAVESCN